MNARPLLLIAAACAVAASETALWLQARDLSRDLAQTRRRQHEHRCTPPSAFGPPPDALLLTAPPQFQRLVEPAPMTDPALEA